jgi:dolichyl-phosphate beta-glucosyltransferase
MTADRHASAPPYLRVVDDSLASATPRLSVIIPAYNAAPQLPGTVPRLLDYLRSRGISFEVVIVDDGSRDGTARVIRDLEESAPEVRSVALPANRGKGAAVNAGHRASRGERIIFMDADGATDLEAIPRFLEALESSEVAVASRHHPLSSLPVRQPLHRRLMGLAMRQLVRRATGVTLLDTQCGFKGFTRPAAALLFGQQRIERFAFDVELCYLARRFGLRLAELPVTWRDREHSSVRLLRDPLNMIVDILRIRLNDLRGLYR